MIAAGSNCKNMPKAINGENPIPEPTTLAPENLFTVAGKVCVVTGGGSGIGAMIAAGLCANKAKVYICSRKDTSAYAQQLTERTEGTCRALICDVGDPQSTEAFAKELQQLEPGGVHALFNNAGTNYSAQLESYPLKGWDKVYNVNVRGVFAMTQVLMPALKLRATPQDPARVINIASIDAERCPALPTFAYASGKAAVVRLSKHLAAHLCDDHVNVNVILPGAFRSRMMRATLEAAEEAIKESIPRKRLGNVHDMTGLAVFLTSKASAWMTGAAIPLDGGALISKM